MESAARSSGDLFESTPWSQVFLAGAKNSEAARAALDRLCHAYWTPLFIYVQKRVRDLHLAQDLTQAFFAKLLEKNYVGQADPTRGRFRTFLLTACQHFLANEYRRTQAVAAGGAVKILPLDGDSFRDQVDPADQRTFTPEEVFDREWALTLLSCVLQKLELECPTEAHQRRFQILKPCLSTPSADLDYETLSWELGVRPEAARMAVSRLRRRYRELLRAEIAHTVSTSEEIELELADLFRALSR